MMNTMHILYHLALADFFERTRRYSFLMILAAVIFLGLLVNNGSLGMDLGQGAANTLIRYHGVLSSVWIGTMTVMVINTFLGLFGFYLVSDCIKRDIHTGVGQIIATTPVRRAVYLIGKWISNFIVLSVLVLILAAAAVIMVLLKSEGTLDLEALLMPFLAVALPNMALTAALAVFFETVPCLRGAVGNVVYFFAWISLLVAWIAAETALPFLKDPIGYNIFGNSLHASAVAAFPNDPIAKGLSVGNLDTPGSQIKIFDWPGLVWTPGIVAAQWLWVAFGLGLVLLSAVWFARFDPSREGLRQTSSKPEEAKEGKLAWLQNMALHIPLTSLSPLVSKLTQVNPFLGVLFAELRMLFNGRRWWWWAITAGLMVAILMNPDEITKTYLIPIAWLWPLAIWSEMGNRERKNNTAQMVFASARPVLRQLPAAWLAGVLATALLSNGIAMFYLTKSDLPALIGWVGAVIFIPTLALALGIFSSGSRVFEVVYVLWWYIGPLQKTAGMDFTSGAPQIYLLASAGLLLLAAFWRGRQVRV